MSPEAFEMLVRGTLAGSLAMLLVLSARRFLCRRLGAQVAYAAWGLVPAVIVATWLPAPTHAMPALSGIVRIASLQTISVADVSGASDPRVILCVLWLAGVVAAALCFAWQQRRYLRSLGRLQAREGTRIVQSDSAFAGPALVGAWRPRIVLPSDFEQRYDARERELILAHEHIHFARGDAWINAFVVALRSLNWFNPLVHHAATRFRVDQELACDAAVVTRFPEARRQYADAMLKVQLAGQSRQELRLPVGCRWPSNHVLKERILMLKQSRPTRAARRLGLGLIAATALACAWAAWASQPPRPASSTSSQPAQEALAPQAQTPPAAVPAASGSIPAAFRSLKQPAYPPQALKQRIEGIMYVKVKIGADGQVLDATLDHAVPPASAAALGESAVAAVKSWTFEPAQEHGVKVESMNIVPIEYAMNNSRATEAKPAQPGELDMIQVRAGPQD